MYRNQDFTLTPLNSGDTHLHVKIFESHRIKDSFLCEVFVPMSSLFVPKDCQGRENSYDDSSLGGEGYSGSFSLSSGVSGSESSEGVLRTGEVSDGIRSERTSGKEGKYNMFSWSSKSGQGSKPVESTEPPTSDPISSFSSLFYSAPPTPAKKTTDDIAVDVDTPLTAIGGKNVVTGDIWYKCYGRGEDKDVERGEICLGLSLESSED